MCKQSKARERGSKSWSGSLVLVSWLCTGNPNKRIYHHANPRIILSYYVIWGSGFNYLWFYRVYKKRRPLEINLLLLFRCPITMLSPRVRKCCELCAYITHLCYKHKNLSVTGNLTLPHHRAKPSGAQICTIELNFMHSKLLWHVFFRRTFQQISTTH